MRPAVRYVAGWTCAALAATTVSWVAIRDVVATAAVGDPVPSGAVVAAATGVRTEAPAAGGESPAAEPTDLPTASRSPRERKPAARPTGTPTRTPSRGASEPRYGGGDPSPSAPAGDYEGFVMTGGQVVVAMREDSASLVAAVPGPGYRTETWKTDFWFRVDFASGDRRSSLIVTWHDGPPRGTVTET
jgi:hypothetical protein